MKQIEWVNDFSTYITTTISCSVAVVSDFFCNSNSVIRYGFFFRAPARNVFAPKFFLFRLSIYVYILKLWFRIYLILLFKLYSIDYMHNRYLDYLDMR